MALETETVHGSNSVNIKVYCQVLEGFDAE